MPRFLYYKIVPTHVPVSYTHLMLTRPANDFVRQFFGHSELGVRLLSLRSVADYVRREERAEGEALAEEMTLRDVLSLFVARGCEVLPVVNTCLLYTSASILRSGLYWQPASE